MSDGTPKILYRQDLSRLGWALGDKGAGNFARKQYAMKPDFKFKFRKRKKLTTLLGLDAGRQPAGRRGAAAHERFAGGAAKLFRHADARSADRRAGTGRPRDSQSTGRRGRARTRLHCRRAVEMGFDGADGTAAAAGCGCGQPVAAGGRARISYGRRASCRSPIRAVRWPAAKRMSCSRAFPTRISRRWKTCLAAAKLKPVSFTLRIDGVAAGGR